MTPPLLRKYPRTPHLEGSRLQPGDEDLSQVPIEALAGRHLVIEEKLDGANTAISFDAAGNLLLQSRGHYLTGGPRERQFDLLKAWARYYAPEFWRVLAARYVIYGEWLFAKHTIFYDALPHYFFEFDIFDIHTGAFLTTPARRALLCELPMVTPVPVLYEGTSPANLEALLAAPAFQIETWRATAQALRVPHNEMDWSGLMEGLYIKDETQGWVSARYKFVRASFHATVLDSGSHWADRPIMPNRLRDGVRILP